MASGYKRAAKRRDTSLHRTNKTQIKNLRQEAAGLKKQAKDLAGTGGDKIVINRINRINSELSYRRSRREGRNSRGR